MMVGRGAKKRGVRYFGPYSHAWAIRETVDLLLRVFPMRSCSNGVFKRSGADRPAVPARLHRQVLGALRRPGDRRGAPRRSSTTSATSWAARPPPSSSASRRRCTPRPADQDYERAARLRDDIGALNRAMEKQQVVLGDGTDADVVAFSEDPLEVAVQIFYVRGGRIRGQRGWVADKVDDADTGGLVERLPPPAVRRGARRLDPARGAGARRCPRTPRPSSSWLGELRRQPGVDPGPAARRQEGAAGDRRPQRAAGARPAQDQAGQRPDHPQPGAGGDPGCARAADRAAAHRVLRHLQPPGHRGGRLDGGVRGRPGPQERVPPLRDQGRRGPERRRLDARGDHPAVPPAARRAGGDRRARRRPGRPAAGRC